MKLRTRVQTLAAAAMLALVAVGLSVGQADAQPKDPVKMGHCALPGHVVGQPEDLVFYVEGATLWILTDTGRTIQVKCGPDGNWIVIDVVSRPSIGRPVVSLPAVAVAQP